ncbi:sec1 family domain-containing protein MIP3 [Rutidosis leptorrhynchoides]|uniref:sec1 family domain-containing protein MIP3 n=1 Tax=Rutidosis leptorrhynchoides TaxID=125765 RepID=UPI003A99EF6B
MALTDVTQTCLDSITQISEHIEGAIVYLDAGCTESFQYSGAFSLLLEIGARAVCSLENVSPLDAVGDWNTNFDSARKIMVMTSRLLSDAHRYILRCLSTHQGVRRCMVFTSIAEVAHSAYPDSPLGPDAYQEYESLLFQDYVELVRKSKTKSGETEDDEGWSQLTTSTEPDFSRLFDNVSERNLHGDNQLNHAEDVGENLVVSVHHFPTILLPLSPRVFVLPSEGSVAEACLSVENEDSLSPGLPSLSTGKLYDGDDSPPGATLTANFLYHLAAKMDLKLEIFSLGDLAKTVGKILTDMSSLYDVGRRKRSSGLLLIDRTLDLLTPCCHGDSLVDRMYSSLPRREGTVYSHTKGSQSSLKRAPLDVKIPLAKILKEKESKSDTLSSCIETFTKSWDLFKASSESMDSVDLSNRVDESQLLDGSLVSTENFCGTPYLEAILDRKAKDGNVVVKKWLQETLRRENITVNMRNRAGAATKSDLQSMIKALAKSQSSFLRNKGIIQIAAATLAAFDEPNSDRWDAFISAEKMLRVSAGDTSQSLASQIGDLINKSALQKSGKAESSSQPLLTFRDALLLTAVGYMIAGENFPTSGLNGPFSWQEEHFLKEAIVDAILENPSAVKLKFLHGLTEELEANINSDKSKGNEKGKSNRSEMDDFDNDDDQWGNWGDDDTDISDDKDQVYSNVQLKLELRDRVDNLFKFLHKLSTLKMKNIPLSEGALTLESYSFTNRGLLHKIITRVLGKHDIPGLEYHSSTVGRLFKSGFGRFGLGQAKPSLADHNVILVFVIGGINCLEVREIQEALSEIGRPDVELILAGTTLLTPDNMFDLLLGDSSFM